MRMSIAMPVYECHGDGISFLDYQFHRFASQRFKDFQVVISDHSVNDDIEEYCKDNKHGLNVKYVRNKKDRGNFSANTNYAIKHCDGEIVKILYQDDFLLNTESLEDISNMFAAEDNWLITSCIHASDETGSMVLSGSMSPVYHDSIYLGNNTIGCPSVLTVRNRDDIPLFDEGLIWLMDVDYYKTLYDRFGYPKVLNKTNVCIRICSSQLTRSISGEIKNKEGGIVLEKHK